ncbi:hypothetical protein [Umezawaea sp. Da 62-37]|uniref:hypothetical protein n=1 Tax=Umezawaea sp. Da 62-37 TaxID=3075927 RepID=UPI0028F71E18|nr:hypothetical protein [Umezawaea sp. Da 62-37]WNV90315.1 hypothetical protein RM788_19150 [Umezawaea sp. Da 62-37]
MAGTQIIGRVAVKVLPDTEEFRADAQRQLTVLEKALRDVKIVVKPNLDMSGISAQARKVRETAAKQLDAINLRVKLDDQGSVQRAIAHLRAELDKLDEKEIKVGLNRAELTAQLAAMEKQLAQVATLNLKVRPGSVSSLQRAIGKIDAELEKLAEVDLKVKMDRASLEKARANLESQLKAATTVDIRVNNTSASSLSKAIAKIDAELEKLAEVELKVKPDRSSLEAARKALETRLKDAATIELKVNKGNAASLSSAIAQIEAELEKLREVEIKIKPDRASLEKTKAELEAKLQFQHRLQLVADYAQADLIRQRVQARLDGIKIAPTIDQATVAKTMREIEGYAEKIEALKAQIKPELDPISRRKLEREIEEIEDRISGLTAEIHTDVNALSQKATQAKLAALARARRVQIIVEMNRAAASRVTAALAALSGARVATNWIRNLGEALSNLDKNVPIIGSIALAVAGLGGWALTAVSNLFALSASLAQIGGAGLALPGILGGIAVGLGVTIAVLKDFNEVIPEVKTRLADLQDQLSERFWNIAEAPIRRLVDKLFPSLEAGAGRTAEALGGFFGRLSDSLTNALPTSAVDRMFAGLIASIHIASTGTDAYAGILAKLGTVGSAYLPRLANWFVDISRRLDDFLGQAAADGRLQGWIDNGIQALADLGTVIVQTGRIFAGVMKAAEAAGGSTLSSLADALTRVADIVNGPRFQHGMTEVFRAAHAAMDQIATLSGPAVARLLETLGQTLTFILPLVGSAIGTLLDSVATALSQPAFQGGLVVMFQGIHDAVIALAPAFEPLGRALGVLAVLIGELARVLGPLLAEVLTTVANVLVKLAPSAIRLVDVLGGGLLRVAEALSPVLLRVAEALAQAADTALVPALTTAIDALVPALEKVLPLIGDAFVTALEAITPILPKLADLFSRLVDIWSSTVADILPQLIELIPTVADGLIRILDAITPLLPDIAELALTFGTVLIPAFVQFAQEVLPGLVDAIVELVGSITPMVDKFNEVAQQTLPVLLPMIMELARLLGENLSSVLSGLGDMFSGTFQGLKGTWEIFSGFLTGDWDKVWNGIKDVGKGIWDGIGGMFDVFLGATMTAPLKSKLTEMAAKWGEHWETAKRNLGQAADEMGRRWDQFWSNLGSTLRSKADEAKSNMAVAWENIKQKASEAWSNIQNTVRDGVNGVIDWVKGIPGRIVDSLGDTGRILIEAGEKVIDGFLSGISAAFGRVKAKLSELTALLPDWKGPASRDRVILFDAGRLVIDSFINGLESRYDAVKASLSGLTDEVAGTEFSAPGVGAPGVSRRIAGITDGALASGERGTQKILNYYAAPGSSISSEEDLFAASGRARMGW